MRNVAAITVGEGNKVEHRHLARGLRASLRSCVDGRFPHSLQYLSASLPSLPVISAARPARPLGVTVCIRMIF
jgi:hypothetical protein